MTAPMTSEALRAEIERLILRWKFDDLVNQRGRETAQSILQLIATSLPEKKRDTEPEIDDDYELGRHHGEIYAWNLYHDTMDKLLGGGDG